MIGIADLLQALKDVKMTLPRTEGDPLFYGRVALRDVDGLVELRTQDRAETTAWVKGALTGEGAVKYEVLVKTLEALLELGEQRLAWEFEGMGDDFRLKIITHGEYDCTLPAESLEEVQDEEGKQLQPGYPPELEVPGQPDLTAKLEAPALRLALERGLQCASLDESRPSLTAVALSQGEEPGAPWQVASMDTYRLLVQEVPGLAVHRWTQQGPVQYLLPPQWCKAVISGLRDETAGLTFRHYPNGVVEAVCEGRRWCAQEIEGQYVGWRKLLEKAVMAHELTLPSAADLRRSVKFLRAALGKYERQTPLRFSASEAGGLLLSMNGNWSADNGFVQAALVADPWPGPVFGVNSKYLCDFLAMVGDGPVVMRTGEEALQTTGWETPDRKLLYLLMPMQLT